MVAIGVDIGGTFTDVVLLRPDGTLRARKVLSTPDDYARGVVQGIVESLREAGEEPGSVVKVVHATTVASNAVLEGLADEAVLTVRSDRRAHPAYGLEGGEAGAPSSNTIRSAGDERSVATMPMEALQLRRGDIFHHVSAGGGGSGSPFERDPALVLEDVLDGKVGIEAARERYGVVIDGGKVDEQATAAVRV